jgi:hypothetical protein
MTDVRVGYESIASILSQIEGRMIYEEKGEHRLILNLIVFLYNYQALVVGLNQIQAVYMSWLERSANTFVGV